MPYTKLFNSLITSTLWLEADHTRLVWITMLALADKNGEVQSSIPGLAKLAGVSLEACRAALVCLLAPDPDSRTKVAEGRRIVEIAGGWELINHAKYRRMASEDDAREANARRQARHRERNAGVTPSNASSQGGNGDVTAQGHKQRANAHADAETDPPSGGGGFDSFWSAYPKKKAKADARKAWKQMKCEAQVSEILKAVARAKKDEQWQKDGGQFIPFPAGWLRKGRWEDEPYTPIEPSDTLPDRTDEMSDATPNRDMVKAVWAEIQAEAASET